MKITIEVLKALKEKALGYELRLYHHNVIDLRKCLEKNGEDDLMKAIDFLLGRVYYITISTFIEPFLKWAAKYVVQEELESIG